MILANGSRGEEYLEGRSKLGRAKSTDRSKDKRDQMEWTGMEQFYGSFHDVRSNKRSMMESFIKFFHSILLLYLASWLGGKETPHLTCALGSAMNPALMNLPIKEIRL